MLSELATAAIVHKEIPTGFKLKLSNNLLEIKVGTSDWESAALQLDVSGESRELAEDVFGKLQGWASDLKPTRWMQRWLDNAYLAGYLMLFWLIVATGVFTGISTMRAGPSLVHERARNMAKQGVTQANQIEALELILSIESGYEPGNAPQIQRFPGLWFFLCFAAGLFFLVVVRFPPRGAIGIWGGKQSLQTQRRWIKFVSVSVPTFIGGSIIVPMILRLIGLSH